MRWLLKPEPLNGAKRTVRRFALWPTEVYDTKTNKPVVLWFELYYAEQVYDDGSGNEGDDDYSGWDTVKRQI